MLEIYLNKRLSLEKFDEFRGVFPTKFYSKALTHDIHSNSQIVAVEIMIREFWKYIVFQLKHKFQFKVGDDWRDVLSFDLMSLPDRTGDDKYLISLYIYDSSGTKTMFAQNYQYYGIFKPFRIVTEELILEFEDWNMVITDEA